MKTELTDEEIHELIINLIKQDLICNKLVLGLTELGLEAGKYHLDIGTLVLKLLGFPAPNENVLEEYFNFMEKASFIKDVEEDREQITRLAHELFEKLLEERNSKKQV